MFKEELWYREATEKLEAVGHFFEGMVSPVFKKPVFQILLEVMLADFWFQVPSACKPNVDHVKWIVAFAFGFEFEPNGSRIPGKVNALLAKVVESYCEIFPKARVWAQWEIVDALKNTKSPILDRVVQCPVPLNKTKGIAEELTSYGVLSALLNHLESDYEINSDQMEIAIIAQRTHLAKCFRIAKQLNFTAWSNQEDMPFEYVDSSSSGQIWTTDPAAFLVHECKSAIDFRQSAIIRELLQHFDDKG